jgi:mannosyltransferase OCH1-like enzyme
MVIPRIFHQIWLGPDPFPDDYGAYRESWRRHHPDWELRLWTESNLPENLRRPEAAERLRAPAERADILRLEVVHRFGGVYVDVDIECLRSIEPLLDGVELFIGLAKPGRVNNALLGSVAGHPLLDRALDELSPRAYYGYDKEAAGPKFLDRVLAGHPEVTLIEPEVFYPQTPEEKQHAYAVHYERRSWKEPELLRIDLARAEQKMESALEKAREWRERAKRAEAELAQLRGSWSQRIARLVRQPRG